MRLLGEEAAEYGAHFRHSPPSPVSPSTAAAEPPLEHRCFPRGGGCPWWPYSSARDFKTNTALVLLILFSAFVCALAFNAAVRYLLRGRRSRRSPSFAQENPNHDDKADAGSKTAEDEEDEVAIPTVIFSAAAAEEGGGGVMSEECTVCLGEFLEGERVRVLENCKHCFHIPCIQRWLNANSSCPTCRSASH